MPWWQRLQFINDFHKGLVIDGKNKISLQQSMRHALVLAPSGMGKSTAYVIPNLLSLKNTSAVVTDPSGELYSLTASYLQKKKYEVRTLDFRTSFLPFQYNPLHRAQSFTEIQKISSILIDATLQSNAESSFWNDSAKSLLALLIRFLRVSQKEAPTLSQLFILINQLSFQRKNIEKQILKTVSEQDFTLYKAFVSQEERIISNVLSTLKTALGKMSDPHIEAITAKETLFFESLRKKKTVLFLIVPEHEMGYYSFLLTLFYTQLFQFAMALPKKGKPYLPVFFFLDEFAALNRIPDFPVLINTLRKRSCSVSIIIQEMRQLSSIYGPNDAAAIAFGGCSNHLYFPGLSIDTCTELEKTLGSTFTKIEPNKTLIRKPLLSTDQIRTMHKTALFISSNQRPLQVKIRPWFTRWSMRRKIGKR